jgi:hypothetical protein
MYRPTMTVDVSVMEEEFLIPNTPVADIIVIKLKLIMRNIALTTLLHAEFLLLGTAVPVSWALEPLSVTAEADDDLFPDLLSGSFPSPLELFSL